MPSMMTAKHTYSKGRGGSVSHRGSCEVAKAQRRQATPPGHAAIDAELTWKANSSTTLSF